MKTSLCRAEDCENLADTRGLCSKHYARWYRTGSTKLKTRSPCAVFEDELPCPNLAKTKGLCPKHYLRLKKHGTTELIPRSINKWQRIEQSKWALSRNQDYKCAICGIPDPRTDDSDRRSFHVDHDHDTQLIRGLLCHNCNLMLGHARDDPRILAKAIGYLAKFDSENSKLTGIVSLLVSELGSTSPDSSLMLS